MERNVGTSSRKQGLGGLDPYYLEDTTNGSSAASTEQYRPTPQASFDSEYFSSQLSQMVTTLESIRANIRSEIRNEIRTKVRNEIRDKIHTLEDRLVRRYTDEQEEDLTSDDEDDFEEYRRRRRSIHTSSLKGKGKQVGSQRK